MARIVSIGSGYVPDLFGSWGEMLAHHVGQFEEERLFIPIEFRVAHHAEIEEAQRFLMR